MLKRFVALIYIICLASSSTALAMGNSQPLRILHVPSYHMSWEWNIDQFQGFKDGIGELNVEYQVVELDTKRASSPEAIAAKVATADQIVSNWQPDLLYTNDDNAQKYFAQFYVGSAIPIVFSAVNRDPSEYNFLGAKNVTGIMEYEHFIPTINLLHSISPNVHRLAVLVDSDPTWKGVIARMRTSLERMDNITVSEWTLLDTYADYKEKIKELQTSVDAIALLGVFNLKDEQGKDVDYKEVLQWTANNSQLPDFSFWESRVDQGTLCAVAVSGYEQGYLAGEMARKILVEKISPTDIPIQASDEGEPMLSLARAKQLGIALDVQLLLNNTIIKNYQWDE